MEFQVLLELLNGTSDVAITAIVYFIWKLERRVYKIENKLNTKGEINV